MKKIILICDDCEKEFAVRQDTAKLMCYDEDRVCYRNVEISFKVTKTHENGSTEEFEDLCPSCRKKWLQKSLKTLLAIDGMKSASIDCDPKALLTSELDLSTSKFLGQRILTAEKLALMPFTSLIKIYGLDGLQINEIKAHPVLNELRKTANLESLNFSSSTLTCLKRAGCNTVFDLAQKTDDEILKIRGIGDTKCSEITINEILLHVRELVESEDKDAKKEK